MEDLIVGSSQENSRVNNTNDNASTSTRVVRVNWLKFLFYSWKRISKLSKLVVISSVLLVILQVATAIAILVTSTNEDCDQPLRTFIIVYMVRIVISCPFYVGEHFERAEQRLLFQRRQERDRRREEQVRLRRLRRREERQRLRQQQQSGVTTPDQQSPTPTSTPNEALVPSNASIVSTVVQPRSNWVTAWGERLKSLVDLFAVLWFIVGNYLLFTSKTCSQDAPKLYYTSLAFILIGYFIVILPLILCTSVILCLPCVLMIMRELNMNEIQGMDQGGRNEEISKIPVFRYRISDQQGQEEQGVTTKASDKNKGSVSKLLQGYRNHGASDPESGAYEDMFITPVEDALCCICLSAYEDKDLLCRLWCGHHFHRSCVTEWLTLNRKCPLCKQDFRGKEYDEDSEDDEDEEAEQQIGESSRHGNEFQMSQLNTTGNR